MAGKPNNLMDNDFKDHKSYRACLNVFKIPFQLRCEYVRTSADCKRHNDQLFNYIEIMACDMKIANVWDQMEIFLLMLIIIAFYIHVVIIVADRFFAPSLKIIIKYMHISEHLAGVTFLAFVNNLADLFDKFYSVGNAAPLFSNSLAGAMIVSMVSGGLICFMCPFRMSPHGIVRDLLFFILGITVCDYFVANDQNIGTQEAIYLIIFYIIYLMVNIMDRILVRNEMKDVKKVLSHMKKKFKRNRDKERLIERMLKDLENDSKIEIKKKGIHTNNDLVDVEANRIALHTPGSPHNRNLLFEFFHDIIPIDTLAWHSSTLCTKIFMLLKAPTHFFCLIFIPRIDLEMYKHGWSKLLNCLHIIIMPSLTAIILTSFLVKDDFFWKLHFNVSYVYYPLPITVPVAFACFLYTRTDLPPRFHALYSVMTLAGSVVIFFIAEAEIAQILRLMSNAFELSEDFIGATLVAGGYSTSDLIVNTVLTLHGYSQMAFATALGGPFLNLVLVTGITFLADLTYYHNDVMFANVGLYGEMNVVFILVAKSTTLIWVLFLNFRARRSVGVFSLLLYLIFLTMAVLVETETIHSWAYDKILQFPNI